MPLRPVLGDSTFEGGLSAVINRVHFDPIHSMEVIDVFACLSDGSLGRRSLSVVKNVVHWDGDDWQRLGGASLSGAVAVQQHAHYSGTSRPAHRVYMKGPGGPGDQQALWVAWSNGHSWSGPTQVIGTSGIPDVVALSAVDSPRGIHVFFRQEDGVSVCWYPDLDYPPYKMVSTEWTGEFRHHARAITDATGQIHVFTENLLTGELMLNKFEMDHLTWTGFHSLGGYRGELGTDVAPSPVFVRKPKGGGPNTGGVFIFMTNADFTLNGTHYCRLDDSGHPSWPEFGLRSVELREPILFGSVCASRAPGVIDLFANNGTSLMHAGQTLGETAAPFGDWEVTGERPFQGPPCVVAADNTIHVFVRGLDNKLWHKWYDGATWS